MKCECGCGVTVKKGRRFISGHNSQFIKRLPSQYKKVSLALSKPKIELICRVCEKIFYVKPYRKSTAIYCSRKCKSKDLYCKVKEAGFHSIGRVPPNKGMKASEETRKKLSESHLGQKAWNAGTGNPVKKRINNSVRSAVGRTISKGSKRMRHWEDLVGWTVTELKIHLESLFKVGMTWENYGEWQIDHKIPIAAFNFNCPDEIDFKKCWALENLQPLWKEENLKKGSRLIAEYGRRTLAVNYINVPGVRRNRLTSEPI